MEAKGIDISMIDQVDEQELYDKGKVNMYTEKFFCVSGIWLNVWSTISEGSITIHIHSFHNILLWPQPFKKYFECAK